MNEHIRNIDEMKMNAAKDRSIEYIMNEINSESKKLLNFTFTKLKLIPVLLLVVVAVLFGVLSDGNTDSPLPNTDNPLLESRNTETLVELSYITGKLVASSFTASTGPRLMSLASTNTTEFEDEIIEFNAYFDMLRAFMEDDSFDDDYLVEELSEGEYSTKLSFMVDGTPYVLLINLDESTITGTLEVNNLILDVTGKLEEEADKLNFEIKAINGQNYIDIEYEFESEDEIEKTYQITSFINGVRKDKEIEISIEENEIKVKLREGDTEYELEKELEDGIIQYALQYHIGEVEGEAIIFETIDQFGNIVYKYQINEDGHEKEIDIEKEDDEDDDQVDDEDEEDEADIEETNNQDIQETKISYL